MLVYSLANFGFNVLGEKRGYTESHQLAVESPNMGMGETSKKTLKNAI